MLDKSRPWTAVKANICRTKAGYYTGRQANHHRRYQFAVVGCESHLLFKEILRLAENEEQAWQLAQVEIPDDVVDSVVRNTHSHSMIDEQRQVGNGFQCYVDGSWKESDRFSGVAWFCSNPNDGTQDMGAANLRRSLTSLHTEVEALIWAMRCMIGQDKREVVFFTDCSDLVKMVYSPQEWPALATYLEAIQSDKEEFDVFSLSLVSRNANVKADKLARNVRTQPQLITYVNNLPRHLLI
ncbi:Ribonuclease H domain [Arabidopsis suecica]|uniref:Ribonuclease H domain n=1 Tax=Arabidopsis suecica TaxID=45249 RepID=A0A8T1Y2Y0_ARASU|nr:Ribonuclease H domain [Arabidopsis suecica]